MQAKLNSRALLEQVFPTYEQVFYNVFSATSLTVLARCLEGDAKDWNETGRRRGSPTKIKPYLTKTSIEVEVIRVGRKKYINDCILSRSEDWRTGVEADLRNG
ncbi:hypothetical protein MKY48_09000 [Paenibacillus sp. FSL W8-0187]|uniref:hypothetical protein n=1 Tax=Paenibacillus sp. FSL W8-0187 TaxID=2921710 RepID=UPI0030D76995